MLTLSSARELAARNIQRAQLRYKEQYDRGARPIDFRLGDWVFVKFPQDETGRLRKLSRPWHGPYRIVEKRDPDATVTKVYHPQHGQIQVHQSRLCRCPDNFPAGYYWYGGRRSGPGRPPKWVGQFLASGNPSLREGVSTPSQSDTTGNPIGQTEYNDEDEDTAVRASSEIRHQRTELNTFGTQHDIEESDELVSQSSDAGAGVLPDQGPMGRRPKRVIRPPEQFM